MSNATQPSQRSAKTAPESSYVLGIDVGGTKIGLGIVGHNGQMHGSDRIPTNVLDGPDNAIQRIIHSANTLLAKSGLKRSDLLGIGIGSPGAIDARGGRILKPSNMPTWVDVPICDILSRSFACPSILENDANAAAVGESRFGAGRGIANLVYITISTGIGAGVIIDNRLMRGENGNAAEIGHITVDWKGRRCPCGNIGCFEAYASGTGMAARAREAVRSATPLAQKSSLYKFPGGPDAITGEAIVEAVRHVDPLAMDLWEETIHILAAGLTSVIHTFNPRRIIIGGGITNAGDLLFGPLRKAIAARAIPSLLKVIDIVPAELGPSVGIFGAAGVAFEEIASKNGSH